MKAKPISKRGGVVLELGAKETQLPSETLFQLKRILVPTDFSECSEKAVAYAVPFAKQFGAELVIAYVVQAYVPVPEMMALDSTGLLTGMRNNAQRELDKLRLRFSEDVKVKTLLRVGNPAKEIVSAADDINADLILLSTHGRTGVGRVFLGSVAEQVTRYARCPVLTVREREHEFVQVPVAKNGAGSVKKQPA